MECTFLLILLYILKGQVCCSNEALTCTFEQDFCGWTNNDWERKTSSGLETSGPSSAADGSTYYIQINTAKLQHLSTITAPFQRISGRFCLKFKYHLYGQHVEYLSYGYVTDANNYKEVRNISYSEENFWYCETFDLSILPETAKGIYFRGKSGVNQYSVIALDSFTYNTGNDCSSSVECPVPTTKPPTTTDSTTASETATIPTDSSDEKWIIIGGSCGGFVVLVIIIVTVCITKMKRRKQLPTESSNQEKRALPPIPQHNNDSTALSNVGYYRRKYSTPAAYHESNNISESNVEKTPQDDYSTIKEETKPYDFGYIQLPLDYETGKKESNTSEQDSDYLEPIVGSNLNQYESDPTKKGNGTIIKDHIEPPVPHIKIPAIPSTTTARMSNTSRKSEIDEDDYDDAVAATTNGGSEQTSDNSDKDSNTDVNDKHDYLDMPKNDNNDYLKIAVNDKDDYLKMTKNDKDDYLDMAENVSNVSDDYITPTST